MTYILQTIGTIIKYSANNEVNLPEYILDSVSYFASFMGSTVTSIGVITGASKLLAGILIIALVSCSDLDIRAHIDIASNIHFYAQNGSSSVFQNFARFLFPTFALVATEFTLPDGSIKAGVMVPRCLLRYIHWEHEIMFVTVWTGGLEVLANYYNYIHSKGTPIVAILDDVDSVIQVSFTCAF